MISTPNIAPGEGIPWGQLNQKNVRRYLACYGHYWVGHCQNMGFCELARNAAGVLYQTKCPLERLCKQESLKYMQAPDNYENGQIDRPRILIRELEKR